MNIGIEFGYINPEDFINNKLSVVVTGDSSDAIKAAIEQIKEQYFCPVAVMVNESDPLVKPFRNKLRTKQMIKRLWKAIPKHKSNL